MLRPAPQVAGDDEDHVGAVVAMSAHHHARVVAGIEGEIGRLGREGQPLLVHERVGAIGVPLSLDGLPRNLGVVDVSEYGLGTGDLGAAVHSGRACRSEVSSGFVSPIPGRLLAPPSRPLSPHLDEIDRPRMVAPVQTNEISPVQDSLQKSRYSQ